MPKEDLDDRGPGVAVSVNLAVVYRQIDQLTPDPANPRRHSCKQIRQIADSIQAFGLNVPILIDRDGKIIAGHGRLLACRLLGITEVPTLCLDHLTAAQARAFMIADNRLTEIATWDDRLLAQQFKDLSLLGLDFSLELTGFEMGEIDLRIASLEDVPDQADDPADALPEFSTQPPKGARRAVSESRMPCQDMAVALRTTPTSPMAIIGQVGVNSPANATYPPSQKRFVSHGVEDAVLPIRQCSRPLVTRLRRLGTNRRRSGMPSSEDADRHALFGRTVHCIAWFKPVS